MHDGLVNCGSGERIVALPERTRSRVRIVEYVAPAAQPGTSGSGCRLFHCTFRGSALQKVIQIK